jgi:hypothetical protein
LDRAGLGPVHDAALVFHELLRDRDRLDVEIAEKRIVLYDLQGGAVPA